MKKRSLFWRTTKNANLYSLYLEKVNFFFLIDMGKSNHFFLFIHTSLHNFYLKRIINKVNKDNAIEIHNQIR